MNQPHTTDVPTVYLDHSATTPTHPDVVAAMLPYFTEHFGNPSSLYRLSNTSREAVSTAREQVAAALGANAGEIFFTAGGTESDNWALKGVAWARRNEGRHIITSSVEHHAILHSCEYLETQGFSVTYLPVDRYGMVDPSDVEAAITPETALISVMLANNEVGTIQQIEEIGALAHDHGICLHTDAVQGIGHIPIDVDVMNIDLLSLSGHKFYGPKGTGALYIRDGTDIDTFIHGGAQEKGRRAGTENVPGIVGIGAAIERVTKDIPGHQKRVGALRDMLASGITERIPDSHYNGHPNKRLVNNAHFSFPGLDGEALLLMLNRRGICASIGSACSSGSDDMSHVLRAMGVPAAHGRSSLRLTLGDDNTKEDVEYVLDVLPQVVGRLRDMAIF
ncbi:cysteine desulfurase NifS [Methanomicrobiaceae archaeon CYW5]|uniref:cysteine desulfurase NifS n=1 Tax=Methanovulcanius yangii TaxID=1789227 RepID=UPI0029C9DF07|nr:cysteine desulfurase NifS [Methanovulcanius yangii]MBT8507442.1 cysteine desulfurase NifS [Methanovulcanius yangii]